MKRLNMDNIIKISMFICYLVYFSYLIISKKLFIYIHPRLMPIIIAAIAIMILTILCMATYIPEKNIKRKKKIKFYDYAFFLIPLIVIIFIEINTTGYTTKDTFNDTISSQTGNIGGTNKTDSVMKDNEHIRKKNTLDISENTINICSNNFLFSLNEILDNPDKYKDYNINISGFVYRDITLNENEFVIGRYIMVCCAADMQITGIICTYDKNEIYNNYTWIKANGKICTKISEGNEVVYLNLESIEKDKNPDTSYIYLY